MVRRALRQNLQKSQVAQAVSIPAPTGGWDAVSPIANMPPENAIVLDNFIPRPGYVELRRGFVEQVTGTAAPIQSLLVYRGLSTGDKLLAAAGGNIYDVTTKGAPLGAPLYSAATVATWQYVNFATLAGTPVMIAVNGTDQPIQYDGNTVTAITFTGSSGTYNLNPNKLSAVTAYQGFLFFIESGTLHVWYPGVKAIAGAMSLLDLGSVFTAGGRLIATGTWSVNYDVATAQFIAFLTDQGQVAIYQGTDPNQIATWALVGVFDLGLPLGPRALVNYGADLIVITADGVVPLSQALTINRAEDNLVALTQRIKNAFSQATRAYRGNFGWEAILYSGGIESSASTLEEGGGSLVIVNVPVTPLQTSVQFVQNIQTGAWCRFTDIPAFCWGLANQCIYFGSAEGVYEWDQGADDNGSLITGEIQMAWNGCGQRARTKQFTMMRPLLFTSGAVEPAIDLDVDYVSNTPTPIPVVVDPGDTTPEVRNEWTSAGATGYVVSPHLLITVKGDTTANVLGDGLGDVISVGDADSSDVLTNANLPFDVPLQVLGFDLLFQPGGQL